MTRKTLPTLFLYLTSCALIILAVYAAFFLYLSLASQNEAIRQNTDMIIRQQREDRQRLDELELQKLELQERLDKVLEILGMVVVDEFEVTAYSPMDPNAIEGMCYEGDPNVTANGGRPIPGETVAAGPGIPFGSRVYLAGYGWRTVNDRGSRITDRHIDLVVSTHSEAWAVGRRNVKGVVVK